MFVSRQFKCNIIRGEFVVFNKYCILNIDKTAQINVFWNLILRKKGNQRF